MNGKNLKKRTGVTKRTGRTQQPEVTLQIMSARKEKLTELEDLCSRGVELFVDGRAVLPGEAVARTVRENSPYMADFVLDAGGDVEQIRFDKVRHR